MVDVTECIEIELSKSDLNTLADAPENVLNLTSDGTCGYPNIKIELSEGARETINNE